MMGWLDGLVWRVLVQAIRRFGRTRFMTAWNANSSQRPSMTEISNQLCTMIEEITEEDGVVPSRT
jgi:hypothetical protein